MTSGAQAISGVVRPAAKPAEVVESKFSLPSLIRFGGVAFQLALIFQVIRAFDIETKGFRYLMAWTLGGFIVHHFLPKSVTVGSKIYHPRLLFFGVLSVVGMGWVIGWTNAAWTFALGMVLIGCAHLPMAMLARIGVMLGVVAVYTAFRADWLKELVPQPWSTAIWPILGSMFMFRMIIYMWDMKNKSAPFSFAHALAYFFMIPNVCFTLFPIVDYQTFTKVYFNTDDVKIYQRGAWWMLRGVVHLLIYRAIYQNFALDPLTVQDAGDAWHHIMASFGLYFKIVGSYTLAMGVLHLFGFNMPLPYHNFLLGQSFVNFWQRANIYWKDFILKLYFQPQFIKLSRSYSGPVAMALALAWAIGATWFLHAYQAFWITSKFPVTWQDVTMWVWLGTGMYVNMLEDLKPKKKTLKKPVRTLKGDVIRGLKISAMMFSMFFMWTAVFTSPGWGETKALLAAFTNVGLSDVAFIVGTFVLYGFLAILWTYTPSDNIDHVMTAKQKLDAKRFWRNGGLVVAGAAALLLVNRYPTIFAFAPKVAEAADNLKSNKLSARDGALLKQGYYEDLSDATRFSPELAALYADRPKDWDVNPLLVQYEGYPDYGLAPSQSKPFKGELFTTNKWGMRDQEYEKTKAPGTYRFALLGQSVEQGSGVADGQPYEAQVEKKLNEKHVSTSSTGIQRWEILNLANGGFGPLHKLAMLEKTGFEFGLDGVIWINITDRDWTANEIISAHQHKLGLKMIPWPEVHEILAKHGIEQSLEKVVLQTKINEKLLEEIVRWVYARVAEESKKRGVRPILVQMAQPEEDTLIGGKERGVGVELDQGGSLKAQGKKELEWARAAGLEVLDLLDVYDGQGNVKDFWIKPYDHHPNLRAHTLMADKLYERLIKLEGLVR
ncbi:hypothetical protein L6R52_22785 [Myxococcota bacterium]|nr:hypothetical protein [Myxococcota bacterium]